MIKKLCTMGLLGMLFAIPMATTTGCGGSKDPVKPDTFAEPPDEADEQSEEGNG